MTSLRQGDFDFGLQVQPDPRFFADRSDADLDVAERRFQRDGPVTPGDGECAASDEAAPLHHHPLVRPRPAIATADDHEQRSLEENILFERRPFFHGEPSRRALVRRAMDVIVDCRRWNWPGQLSAGSNHDGEKESGPAVSREPPGLGVAVLVCKTHDDGPTVSCPGLPQ